MNQPVLPPFAVQKPGRGCSRKSRIASKGKVGYFKEEKNIKGKGIHHLHIKQQRLVLFHANLLHAGMHSLTESIKSSIKTGTLK